MNSTLKYIALLLLLAGCAAGESVKVAITPEAAAYLPHLPEGYVDVDNTQSGVSLTIELMDETGPTKKNEILLESVPLLPLLPADETRDSITVEEIDTRTLMLVPLSDWNHGPRSAPVEGLTAADPGYPLMLNRKLKIDWGESVSAADREILSDWLYSVPRDNSPVTGAIRWIAAVGDVMVQRGVEDLLINYADGQERIFSDLLPAMRDFDLLLGNLEGAVTRGGTRIEKSYNFRFRPEVLGPLKAAGFDYFSLTNNHCYDYGETGFIDTLENLEAAGIATSGAGRSPADAIRPARFSLDGQNIRILSVGAYPQERNGFNGRNQAQATEGKAGIHWYGDQTLAAVKEFAAPPGIDIIMIHGGEEWQARTNAEQRAIYRSLIDAGAEVVFGSHPHVLQGAEVYNGGIIYYSLGNFIFNGMQGMPGAEDSLIATVGVLQGKLIYRNEIPVILNGPRLKRDESGRILKDFRRLSAALPAP